MKSNLWSANHPARFWQCQPELPEEQWQLAVQKAIPVLGLPDQPKDIGELLELTLGEGQFGANHWQLNLKKKIYYELKPYLPRAITRFLRRLQRTTSQKNCRLGWPVEDRYVRFIWEVRQHISHVCGPHTLEQNCIWPEGNRYSFVLTHDVETAEGQAFVNSVAKMEETLGFRSSFNFVTERYPLDMQLIESLRDRGFEIGVHGLKHDGKLYNSHASFVQRAERINTHLRELGAVGFRSPLMMRNPDWLQMLDIEYDMSFFDTDPFEPIPGGVMSIWPFFLGKFIELPYTLPQDHTLTNILGETTPKLWLEKVAFIEQYQGMALVNTHPDYLIAPLNRNIYTDFLLAMISRKGYWHALPKDVAHWWRVRQGKTPDRQINQYSIGTGGTP